MLEKSTEMSCLCALKEGDEKAFTVFYNTYWDLLFGVAYTTTRSKETAQEIVQEVFLSFWANRKTLNIQTTVKAYLCGAIRHAVFNYFDKQVVRDNYKTRVVAETSVMINTTEDQVAFDEIESLVHQEIERLPETTKTVFVLSRLRGFSIPEIAKQLSLSGKAVEYHLTKALKYLRPRLADYTSDSPEVMVLLIAILLL